ncbi:MAG: ATP-binding protein [Thermoproteota archaeon]
MLRLYRKDGDTLELIEYPSSNREKGGYLGVEDKNGLLVLQIIETTYLEFPGLVEEMLKDPPSVSIETSELDVLDLESILQQVKNAILLKCKIRGAIVNGSFVQDVTWIPSRVNCIIKTLDDSLVLSLLQKNGTHPIRIGTTRSGVEFVLDAEDFDGGITVITGKKGTGKSHLSKLILKELVDYGAPCLVFDVNGEYASSHFGEGVKKGKVVTLVPGENFKVTLDYVGLDIFLGLMEQTMSLPSNSSWELRRIWEPLQMKGSVTIRGIRSQIFSSRINEYVKDALIRRIDALESSKLFTESPEDNIAFEQHLLSDGGVALIFDLHKLPNIFKSLVVELILKKVKFLLESNKLPAVFLFAEEAHIYQQHTFWEDIVTRMRHLGIFSIFITNEPNSLSETIYRQADNIFLFNFTNENDLAFVSKASTVDAQTVINLVKSLPTHHCLSFGRMTLDFPIVVRVEEKKYFKPAETRCFFSKTIGGEIHSDRGIVRSQIIPQRS